MLAFSGVFVGIEIGIGIGIGIEIEIGNLPVTDDSRTTGTLLGTTKHAKSAKIMTGEILFKNQRRRIIGLSRVSRIS